MWPIPKIDWIIRLELVTLTFHQMFLSFSICLDPMSRCMDDRLTPFYSRAFEFNAQITQPNSPSVPRRYFESIHQLVPYVGNGYFGIGAVRSTPFHVKYGRHLSQPVNFHPVVEFESADGYSSGSEAAQGNQAFVIDYLSGVVHKFQCFENEYTISSDFYGNNQSERNLYVDASNFWFFFFLSMETMKF